MSELKNMEWDTRVWSALCASITPMPPFVRKRALLKIIKTSEDVAKSRGSELVEADDLIKAVYKKVPEQVRKMCLESLAEHGINAKTE
jgi:hypothetical protein